MWYFLRQKEVEVGPEVAALAYSIPGRIKMSGVVVRTTADGCELSSWVPAIEQKTNARIATKIRRPEPSVLFTDPSVLFMELPPLSMPLPGPAAETRRVTQV